MEFIKGSSGGITAGYKTIVPNRSITSKFNNLNSKAYMKDSKNLPPLPKYFLPKNILDLSYTEYKEFSKYLKVNIS